MEKNKINELPKSLGELESLEELKMKESLVKEIPDSIVHCKKLQKIHCPEKIKINKITLDVLKETGVKFET